MSEREDIRMFDFVPLSEAKAKLSEKVRTTTQNGRRIAITNNGRPTAILLSYEDFLSLLPQHEEQKPMKRIDYAEWEKGRKKREQIRDSIVSLFNVDQLSRKGQKSYKEKINVLHLK
jgi:prevent-host-death family protein